MRFFLDTANLDQISKARDYGVLDGVTTNPSILSREGKDWRALAETICSMVEGPVSLEVMGTATGQMVAEAVELAKIGPNVVVKIPMTKDGIKAVAVLRDMNIPVNVTLIFSPLQALLAAKAGANYVSPFVGRLDDIGHNGMEIVVQIQTIFEQYGYDSEVLVASVRSTAHVLEAAMVGANIVTIPFSILEQLFSHPLTSAGLDIFMRDAQGSGWKSKNR
ncbi:MAG: fructose-6-phosphate aldolase [Deltaproteobacteria bacterium]|nr:fructose-6-phosphate aldolase [Deltaproteobacteria bacterium]